MIKIIGYAPDVDPTTPGVITDCDALIPSLKGMVGAPTPSATGLPALASKCMGSAVLRKLDATTRFFAGTQTALYEASTSSWTDRSKGGGYTGGTESLWRFAQFGNISIATNKADTMQASTTGAFSDISASGIKAAIVETVNYFVFAFDTNETTYGDSPDRWWCSALGDYTDWVPDIGTQCATGSLTSVPGKIRAGKRLGDNIVVYKDRGMYVGRYAGPPIIWDFIEIPGEIGTPCQETVVNIGTAHIFMGYEDFYIFDGSRPVPIGSPVKETFFGNLHKNYAHLSKTLHDRIRSRIYFYYPSLAGGGAIDSCLVYNYKTDRWGVDDRTIESTVEYISAGTTYDGLGTLYSTYADLPSLPYDSPFWVSNFPTPAIFDTTHTVKTLTGATGSSSLTTGDLGDDEMFSTITRVKPRFLTAPTSSTLTNYYRSDLGDSLTSDQTVTMSSARYDFIRSSRWHRFQMNFTGNVEIVGYKPTADGDGDE